jgi:hypothetical protein
VFHQLPKVREGAGVVFERELAEVKLNAGSRVGVEPMKKTGAMALSTEGKRVGEVVVPFGCWEFAHTSRS